MLNLGHVHARDCEGTTRREFLQVGAVGFLGLTLPGLFAARQAVASATAGSNINCIMLFLWGGPPQVDTWDMKPDAPAEVRGEFRPIRTNVPGIQICELMPMLAKCADRYTIVRSATHDESVHARASHYTLTGSKLAPGRVAPNAGAVVTRFLPQRTALPAAAVLGPRMFDTPGNGDIGQDGGFLGSASNPFRMPDVLVPVEKLAALTPPAEVPLDRVEQRRELLKGVDAFQRHVESAETKVYGAAYERAFSLVTSPAAKRAFDLTKEPDKVRDRYGRTQFGQGALMARRLVEAGTRFVQVNWRAHPINDAPGDGMGFDNHGDNYPRLRKQLPELDQVASALIEDLHQRGMLRKTLVLVTGEFGRTPKMEGSGRNHWPGCYSFLIAGAGIPGGRVIGASDRFSAWPAELPVKPEDTMMSVYRLLGMDVSLKLREARIVGASPGIPNLFG
jgi:hypothetical protein